MVFAKIDKTVLNPSLIQLLQVMCLILLEICKIIMVINWDNYNDNEPNFFLANQFCVNIGNDGEWSDDDILIWRWKDYFEIQYLNSTIPHF